MLNDYVESSVYVTIVYGDVMWETIVGFDQLFAYIHALYNVPGTLMTQFYGKPVKAFMLSRVGMDVQLVMSIVAREEQPQNAFQPIEVTVPGIVNEVNDVQPLNVSCPIAVIVPSKVIPVKDVQPLNAQLPKEPVTLLVVVTDDKYWQPQKALSPIPVM